MKAVSTGSAVTARPFSPPRIRHLETGWSNAFLRTADRVLHRVLFDFLAGIGVWVAVLALRQARRSSRRYLAAILGRPPSLLEVWRHFMAFTAVHLVRLRVAGGRLHDCRAASGCEAFAGLMASGRPALLGTFHIGSSDLMGFYLGRFRRHVHMVRFRLGDPGFLRQLVDRCSAWVTFIWVNEKGNLLFALKQAVESGGSIAMKCDRVGYSAKLEAFDFLGARRSFPFTIYHLGVMFGRPVTFCVSLPVGRDESAVHGFPVFETDGASREENLARARAHFQAVLVEVESLLRANPYQWFNFGDLNPVAAAAVVAARGRNGGVGKGPIERATREDYPPA